KNVIMQLTGTDEGPSRPRGKDATTSVWRAKAQAVEAAGGRPKPRRVARTQPQGDPKHVAEPIHVAEPQPDVVHVAEPQPDLAPAPAAEEDD
ncbi:hypothetical protein A2U01_0078698, partial [Trifolium medium]|nr:hypothetical protein [Trifolium medium]